MEAGGLAIQDHCWLLSKCEDHLGCVKPLSQTSNKKKPDEPFRSPRHLHPFLLNFCLCRFGITNFGAACSHCLGTWIISVQHFFIMYVAVDLHCNFSIVTYMPYLTYLLPPPLSLPASLPFFFFFAMLGIYTCYLKNTSKILCH